jgi:hypothetical protein
LRQSSGDDPASIHKLQPTHRTSGLSVAGIVESEATNFARTYDSGGMKKCIYLLMALGLFAACEQKTTTVNPPAEKKESNTTVINPPSEKKETNTTVVNPPGQTKEEKTDINVNTSPNP